MLEEVHVVGDADENHLTGVDLEQDENLVTHQEQTSFPRVLQPLVAVVAEQEIVLVKLIFIVVRIDEFKADCDANY